MRDLIVLAIVLGSVPLCLRSPFFGVCMWYWIAYFNPHRFTWTIAYDFPVAAVVAVPTLMGAVFTRKQGRILRMPETLLLLALWAWCALTYVHATTVPLFAAHMPDARYELIRFSKILLLTVVMMLVVTSRPKFRILMLVTAFSFGLLAIRATMFGFRTLGEFRVLGPPDSFLTDNNAFALALNMSLPMFFFLAREDKNRWMRRVLYLFLATAIVGVILSYSRGGLVGLAITLAMLMFKMHRKILGAMFLLVCGFLVLTFAPERWMDRMGNFVSGNLDASAQQRLVAWGTAWNFVLDNPIAGGGFHTLPDVNVFQRYQLAALPGGFRSTGPHSIFVQFFADHGFVGLTLFLLLLATCMVSLSRLRTRARRVPEVHWVAHYADLIQVSLLAYMASGAFLGLGYFDLAYQVLASTVVLGVLYAQEVRQLATSREERVAVKAATEPVAV